MVLRPVSYEVCPVQTQIVVATCGCVTCQPLSLRVEGRLVILHVHYLVYMCMLHNAAYMLMVDDSMCSPYFRVFLRRVCPAILL